MATPFLAFNWLIQLIPSFLETYPQLRIRLAGQYQGFNFNEVDVHICPHHSFQPDLVQRHLMDMPIKFYASHTYLNKKGIPLKPEDLTQHQIIAFGDIIPTPHDYINWPLTLGRKIGQFRYPYIEINSTEGMARAAAKGLGIAMLPSAIADNQATELIEVLPHLEPPVIPIYYVYPEKFKKIEAHHCPCRFS